MALKGRVWRAGKVFLLLALLAATYVASFVIAMRVAIRSRDVQVPSLTGRTVNEATQVLSDIGLTLRVEEGRRLDAKIPAGRVAAQDPRPGVTTRSQRNIKVWLSDGPFTTIVPALVGESERTAQIRVQTAALTLSDLSEVRSSEYAAGVVIGQSPPPETKANSVALLVNRGEAEASYVMPDLIGVDGEHAANLLRNRGFRVTVVGDQPYQGLPAGTVIRQRPHGGFQVAPGDPISLEVSR
jgi:beta-lactam-binding protein with PASTA domain